MKETKNFILVGGVVVAAVGLFFYYRNEERGVEALGDLAHLAQAARAASNTTAGASHIHPSLSDTVLATRAFEPWAPAPVVKVYAESLPNIISGPAGVFPNLSQKDAEAAVNELREFGNDVKTVTDRITKEIEKADPSKIDWQKVSADLRFQIGEDRSQLVDFLVGRVPSKAEVDKALSALAQIDREELNELEAVAAKVWEDVKAHDDGGDVEKLVKQFNKAYDGDRHKLVTKIRRIARQAGIPVANVEYWAHKEGRVSTDKSAQEVIEQLRDLDAWLPDPDAVHQAVSKASPSCGKLYDRSVDAKGAK
ncbi:hypothetical protein Q8F55_004761 [Vanrija albida]|uniref:MICOS complex subunit MIC60 n=1 Tax=Vanrija albida TaxID=181172 RepID=A0ABR3PZP4_9TREE